MSRRPLPCRPAIAILLLGVLASACSKENPKLMVTGLEPEQGDAQGGAYVRIKGNRFTADGPRTAKVYFGGRQGTVVRFESDRELIVQAPGGKPDEVVDVLIVFDPGGQRKIANGFRFVDRSDAGMSVDDLTRDRKK